MDSLEECEFLLVCGQAVWMATHHGCQKWTYTAMEGFEGPQAWFTPILRFCYSKKKNKKTWESTFLKRQTLHYFELLPNVEHCFSGGGQEVL